MMINTPASERPRIPESNSSPLKEVAPGAADRVNPGLSHLFPQTFRMYQISQDQQQKFGDNIRAVWSDSIANANTMSEPDKASANRALSEMGSAQKLGGRDKLSSEGQAAIAHGEALMNQHGVLSPVEYAGTELQDMVKGFPVPSLENPGNSIPGSGFFSQAN